jgi:hypothetical protein
MATNKIYNVEPREEGYAVIADGGKKASALTRTQAEGIAEARRLNPNAKPNVAISQEQRLISAFTDLAVRSTARRMLLWCSRVLSIAIRAPRISRLQIRLFLLRQRSILRAFLEQRICERNPLDSCQIANALAEVRVSTEMS